MAIKGFVGRFDGPPKGPARARVGGLQMQERWHHDKDKLTDEP